MTAAQDPFVWGGASTTGRRPTNEDSHILQQLTQRCQATYAAVFDGHGGASAAVFSGQNLHQFLQSAKDFPDDVPRALTTAFTQTDRAYIKQEASTNIFDSAGATATVCVHCGDRFYFANAGDSRSIIGLRSERKCRQITTDHKPSVPSEKQRIEQYGSSVIEQGDDVCRVAGMLAVSRAIGDAPFKGCGVIATPETFVVPQGLVNFVILACDGLWDVLSNDDVGIIVNSVLDAASGAGDQNSQDLANDPRAVALRQSTLLFLKSTLNDNLSKQAEQILSDLAQSPYGAQQSDTQDVVGSYIRDADRFAPANIAKILAKSAVALGSDDNVSVMVGVAARLYRGPGK